MAKFGTFLFGTTLFGATATGKEWFFMVDWDDDGDYDLVETSRVIDMRSFRGRRGIISPSGDGLQSVVTGSAVLTLDNYDGRYDPFNASSPLYDNVEPGKYCKIQVTDGTTLYTVFTGIIEDITPSGGRSRPVVKIRVVDGYKWLTDADSSTALYTDIDTDTAIGHILTDINYPAIWGTSIGSGLETIPYWWGNGRKSHLQIQELADSELGHFYIDNAGQAVFENRQTTKTAAYTLTQDEILKDIYVPQPWDVVRNIVNITYEPRAAEASQSVWELFDVPSIPANGGELEIWAEYTYNTERVPAENVITPVATTDYLMNTEADGSGANTTTDVSISIDKFADVSKITYTNNGASTGYLTWAQLRGDPLPTKTSRITSEKGDYATKPKSLTLRLPWLQSANTATDFANFLATQLSVTQAMPTIQLEDRFTEQFSVDLFDTITLTINYLGIDDDYMIGGIEHNWLDENGEGVRTIFYTELFADPNDYWKFPTNIGTKSYFGW